MAKMLLFLTHLSLIEFIISLLYNYNYILNDAAIKNVILCIFFGILAGWIGKYIFGIILYAVY